MLIEWIMEGYIAGKIVTIHNGHSFHGRVQRLAKLAGSLHSRVSYSAQREFICQHTGQCGFL